MSSHPTGTISFLFTDIEGSTRRWEEDPAAMRAALAHHDELLRKVIEEHGGFLFKHTGDGMCAAFSAAADAVRAAASSQRALRTTEWPSPFALTSRMGIHTGDAALTDGDYFGSAVNKTARVMDAGHGGQVLLSSVAAGLARRALPEATTLDDLGEHRLKDLSDPERLFQLTDGDGTSPFPALRTLEMYPNNLPTQVSSFVGRAAELEELVDLVGESRLVTLTGVGGVGKTRLALQVAAELAHRFPDGVWLVELASVADDTLIPREVAGALEISEEAHRSLLETLRHELADRELLIVLDNCEHVIDAAAKFVDDALRSIPGLKMIVTSREGLAVAGEMLWRVPSLSVTEDSADAVELFAERARQMRRDFSLDEGTLDAVRKICTRLDGIPLAIELAAARLKMLRADQLAERLDDRFRLLTGGSRTALPRQRTLQAMMDWSHDLLSTYEQVLLRRLAVFHGGFTLDAAEEVCADGDVLPSFEILDLLSHLVEASLVAFDDDVGRYRLLETVRQYGLDKLIGALEGETLRLAHLVYYTKVSDGVHAALLGDQAEEWLARLVLEADNFRAAMTWSLEANRADDALRMAAGLGRFFFHRSMLEEALDWYGKALGAASPDASTWRAEALGWDSGHALHAGDVSRAERSAREGVALARELGDPVIEGRLLVNLGNNAGVRWEVRDAINYHLRAQQLAAAHDPDYETVTVVNQVWSGLYLGDDDVWRPALERLDTLHETGTGPDAWVHLARGWAALEAEDLAAATPSFREGLEIARRSETGVVVAFCLGALAAVAAYEGDMDLYRERRAEALRVIKEVGSPAVDMFSQRTRARSLAATKEWAELRDVLRTMASFATTIGHPTGLVFSALPVAAYAINVGKPEAAVVLIAAQDAWLASQEGRRLPLDQARYEELVGALRAELDAAAYDDWWGQGLSIDHGEVPALVAGLVEAGTHSPG